jgi:pimeloyl-ACP methyl ester carboxylesterase
MNHVTHIGAPSRALLFTEPTRAAVEFGAFLAAAPLLRRAPHGDGHSVLVLPGFLADDRSTLVLRNTLGSLGYHTYGWGLGRNVGPTAEILEGMRTLLTRLADSSGAPVSIVGWSLGGMFARGLGHELPQHIRQIVTLGSPFRSDAQLRALRPSPRPPLRAARHRRRPGTVGRARVRRLHEGRRGGGVADLPPGRRLPT